ncbi:helix-turn-helix domain-containing protein [Streptomyces sp. MS19]|uniref:helix-turn-helix domain-containing protein n=1 Tax=Streptomyces sp. MS19 TaxID=3385972 RepID=UPI0039A3DE15
MREGTQDERAARSARTRARTVPVAASSGVAHGLGPLDSLVSHAAAGAAPAAVFASRGWSAQEWDAARAGLAELLRPAVRDIVRAGLLPSQSALGIRMAYGHL